MSTNDDFDELAADAAGDEKYFEDPNKDGPRAFDSRLLREPLSVLPVRAPLVFSPKSSTTDAMRVMHCDKQ